MKKLGNIVKFFWIYGAVEKVIHKKEYAKMRAITAAECRQRGKQNYSAILRLRENGRL